MQSEENTNLLYFFRKQRKNFNCTSLSLKYTLLHTLNISVLAVYNVGMLVYINHR